MLSAESLPLKSLVLSLTMLAPIANAEPATEINWPVRQVAANFSHKNDAAPIHFRQLHTLYPSRKIANSEAVSSLPVTRKQLKVADIRYDFDGKESIIGDYIDNRRLTGLLVIKDGKIVHESNYFGYEAASSRILFSTTKSIVSLLVGIAIDEGLINNVNEPLVKYLPELKGSGFDGASIKNVLQMTTALYFEGESAAAAGEGRDIRGATVRSLAFGNGGMRQQPKTAQHKPGAEHGEAWEYLNTNSQVLTVLLERVAGTTVAEFAQEKLWTKLGTEQPAYWLVDRRTDEDAMEHGWMGLVASLHDLGRIGLMVANEGKFNGHQIVSGDWLRESTTADNTAVRNLPHHKSTDYGYQWWIPHGDAGEFMSVGFAGQIIYVNPSANAVVAQTAADPDYGTRTKEEAVAVYRALLSSL
ncbi:hypothetical protein SAMN04487965_0281 [Microbulbifer donghaiensis]|uniref:Beta-lactamase-related domain-containing protein n=1 Tax=Microbulbifer donghaiensis TaxID=494016 RepID=A0A1M4UYS7_9GAMM|nr:serine hydrolase [Microbulbifer donghaiensis]SHE61819.1 hypothetical protein SAMN04487965_0281 [Microbulbifer donghaiensis]